VNYQVIDDKANTANLKIKSPFCIRHRQIVFSSLSSGKEMEAKNKS